MNDYIFLTGATGFLGTRMLQSLMEQSTKSVYVLVKAWSNDNARIRLLNLWWEIPVLRDNINKRIIPVVGDITLANLGLSQDDLEQTINSVGYVIHSAAEVRLTASKEHLWAVNVEGTKNVLAFAVQINNNHGLKRFSHISTAYVAGLRKGQIPEDLLSDADGFGSFYEQSKYEAEVLVHSYKKQFPLTVFRPGQIIGDSKTGKISTFNTLYYPIKLFLNGKLKILPMKRSQKINMVPVDFVADAVIRLSENEQTKDMTFHLTTPGHMQPAVCELIQEARQWAKKNLNVQFSMPVFVPASVIANIGIRRNKKQKKQPGKKSVLSNMLTLSPYFLEDRVFMTDNTEYFLGKYPLQWKDYLNAILAYATSKGFLNHSERTVFEQIRFQLNRKSNPVCYFDVSNSGIKKITGEFVNQTADKAKTALQGMGIKNGNRVAVTGINCSKLFIIDSAIGLSGAVSVPIYYTTPPEEIDSLLERSGAKVFFVGDERILSKIEYIKSDIPVISFVEGYRTSDLNGRVISWDSFLSHQNMENCIEPVCYESTATIRYTSGTTGEPKGVMFNHYQLRWMGETLASLLSWKTKSKPVRYLSFLPMSHVVEGILATYAPYYLPNKAEIYFLNDFGSLVDTLPKVRPTVFFSVPHFYEKVWDKFMQMKPARYYLDMKDGQPKRLLGAILKRALLRKAGLDKCDQLIAGSAPISNELMQSFRGLGIEIHNAYGLTEAPLISLSKLNDNEIGSTGALLPETEVMIRDDGEILVKGPQVARGYYGSNASAVLNNGFMETGDFGCLSESGKLVISGRKKELLVTSYGKNINPQKIEIMMKNIPGVSESMLVGDNFPYCTALIWSEQNNSNNIDFNTMDNGILEVNNRLSVPEQIKKWVILRRPLSIAMGELTPNLKLRRNNIANNYEEVLLALYGADEVTNTEVIHMGCIS